LNKLCTHNLPKRVLRKEMRFAIVGCIHAPHNPVSVWDWALSTISDFKPNGIINLGDHQEASANSHHPTDDSYTLEEEYRILAKQKRELRALCLPRGVLVDHDGNHEYRYDQQNIKSTVSKRVRYTTSKWAHPELASEMGHWLHVPYRNSAEGIFRLGQLMTRHGHQVGGYSDEHEALLSANITDAPLYSLSVRSHTHRPKQPTQCRRTAQIPLRQWYANVGTLGPLQPAYAHGMNNVEWGHGLLLVTMKLQSHYSSREWEAELVSPSCP
jgi:hypothetical protein